MDNSDNPIDQAFDKDLTQVTATPELNYVAEKYMQAWKTEMNNAAAVIKQQYQWAAFAGLVKYRLAIFRHRRVASLYFIIYQFDK